MRQPRQSFPVLFDLVDESETAEVDGVARRTTARSWTSAISAISAPRLNAPTCPLRIQPRFPPSNAAKAVPKGQAKWRDRLITSTDAVFSVLGQPGIADAVNFANGQDSLRSALQKVVGIHENAPLPKFHSKTFKRQHKGTLGANLPVTASGRTQGRVAVFTTCYGNYNEPQLGADLAAVFLHNDVPVKVIDGEKCCGMPKFELGDLTAVKRLKEHNIPVLLEAIEAGWDIIAPVPSCVLMFKQELPLCSRRMRTYRRWQPTSSTPSSTSCFATRMGS